MMQHSVGLFSVMSDENSTLSSITKSGTSSLSGGFDLATPQKQTVLSSGTAVKSSRKALVDLSNGQVNNRNGNIIISTPNVLSKTNNGKSIILQSNNTLTKTAPKAAQFIIKSQHDENKNINENIKSKNIFKKNLVNNSNENQLSKSSTKQTNSKAKVDVGVIAALPAYSTDEMLCSRVTVGDSEDVYDIVMRKASHMNHSLVPTTGMSSYRDADNIVSMDYDFSGSIDVPMNYGDFEDKATCFCDDSDASSSFLVPSECFLDE